MMFESKKSGCDAVKLQAFTENIVREHPEKERLLSTSVSESNIDKIDKTSREIGIEWFCTPMYPEAVKFLDPYVSKYKIRFSDGIDIVNNKRSKILDRLLQTKKEIFISSNKSPKKSSYYNNRQMRWLYVVPKYHCEITDLDFRDFKDFDGYSNHCPHFLAPLTASILGAKIIELHITSDKSKEFFDNNVSFDYDELKELIKLIRLSEKIRR
jgi:sialic acid synthase SpsE